MNKSKNEVTLEWFLRHVYADRNGYAPPIWIYEWVSDFYPDDVGRQLASILAVFRSDFVPNYTFTQKFCDKVVREIYWTDRGILLLVDEPSEEEK